MNRKNILLTMVCASASLCADNTQPPSPKYNNPQGNQMPMTQQGGANCAQLTADEQSFAAQLTPANATTFCSRFTSAQRRRAMQLTTTPDATGTMMNPDGAVQKVVQEGQSRMGGACPVK